MPDHAYSTYIGVGVGGWIEVFTSPKDPTGGVATVLELVEAMVAGRLRERVWWRKGAETRVSSLLYIQLESGGRWRTTGRMNRPLPLLRRWRYEEQTVEYDAYDF